MRLGRTSLPIFGMVLFQMEENNRTEASAIPQRREGWRIKGGSPGLWGQ